MVDEASNGFGKAEAPKKTVMAAGPYSVAVGLDAEKKQLVNKLFEVQRSGWEAQAKWWSFCKVHAEGNTDPKAHDVAFLQTFFESLEAGEISIEEGCPFQPKGKGGDKGCKGGKDGKAGAKDWGAKGFGKDWGAKGFGKDKGGKGGKGAGGPAAFAALPGGGGDDCKIFAGRLPRDITEQELSAHFSWYGTVTQCVLKYDDMGGFRGFGFVHFDSAETTRKVLADAANMTMKGKWIDVKPSTSGGGGGGGSSKGKGDKGGKGKGDMGGKGKGDKGDKGFKGGKGGKDKGGGKKGGKDKGGWGGGGWGGGGW